MTVRKVRILQSLASKLVVAAISTTLGSAPIAFAADTLEDFQIDLGFAWFIAGAADNHSNGALNPNENIGYSIIEGMVPSSRTAPAASITKSITKFGALSPIPGTKNVDDCLFSLGVALHPAGKFVYLSGGIGLPGRLCGFAIDPVTLAWTPVTPPGVKPAAVGSNPRTVAIEPSGRFLYVAGDLTGTVAGFAIDRVTGVPTSLPGSPFSTSGSLPIPVVIDRSGRFVYVGQSVGSFDGSIAVLAIDSTTGALSHIPGSPFSNVANGGRIAALALSPDGRFLFTGGSALATYAVNPTTGAPTRIASRAGYYYGLAVDPTGRFLFGVDDNDDLLHGFSIAADGTLAPVGVPQKFGSVTQVTPAIATVADLVYVGNAGAGGIYGFRINPSTGALAPVAGSPFASPKLLSAFAARANLPPSIQVDAGDNIVATVGVYGGRPPYAWSVVGGALPPGSTLNATTGVFSGVLNAPGTYSFMVRATDSLGATVSATKSISVNGSGTPFATSVIEYYNASLDHYFITWVADEIVKLDAGTVIKGWTRTGKSFPVYTSAQLSTSPVCRYYIPPGKGDSHFFGRGTAECDATGLKNPTFVLEDPNFMHMILPTAGVCPANTLNVYRVFSNRPDANHRYMIDKAVRDAMVGKGWLAEGDGAETVVMCAPA